MTKAILVVSFGTTYPESREKTIGAVEKRIADHFNDAQVFRAFTSKIVISRIHKNEGIKIDNPETAVKRILDLGFDELMVQPLHLLSGIEYKTLKTVIDQNRSKFSSVIIGKPLLSDFSDYESVISFINKLQAKNQPKSLVLMGHGTSDSQFSAYACLDHMLLDTESFMAAVESYPDIDGVIKRIIDQNISNVVLQPFMIVAGNHAHEDMIGESPDSWQSKFKANGINVDFNLAGLGEYPEIQQMFVNHLVNAMEEDNG